MPDWRNEDDYERTKTLSAEGWAWEFLRRNPEYRKDYEKLCVERKKRKREASGTDDSTLSQG